MSEPRDLFERLAERGSPAGSAEVLRRARTSQPLTAINPRSSSGKRAAVLAASFVLVLALAVSVGVALDNGGGTDHSNIPAAPVQTSTPSETAAPSTAPPTTSTKPPDTTIPPPKYVATAAGLGDARFGMTLAQASAVLGTSLQTNRFTPGCTDINILPKTAFGVNDEKITYLQTESPQIYTETGQHVGSASSEVSAAYPSAKREPDDNGALPLVYHDPQGTSSTFTMG